MKNNENEYIVKQIHNGAVLKLKLVTQFINREDGLIISGEISYVQCFLLTLPGLKFRISINLKFEENMKTFPSMKTVFPLRTTRVTLPCTSIPSKGVQPALEYLCVIV